MINTYEVCFYDITILFEIVYVHCTAGIGRAPSLVVIYLCVMLNFDLDSAIRMVKNVRKTFHINMKMLKESLENALILKGC